MGGSAGFHAWCLSVLLAESVGAEWPRVVGGTLKRDLGASFSAAGSARTGSVTSAKSLCHTLHRTSCDLGL